MRDRPIASDLSYEVLQRRARRFELATPQLDSRHERLVLAPGHIDRHAVIASTSIPDSYQGGLSYTPDMYWQGYYPSLDGARTLPRLAYRVKSKR